jgi:siroheme synthase
VLRTTLGRCTLDVRRAGVAAPALVVIGEVVALADATARGAPTAEARSAAV